MTATTETKLTTIIDTMSASNARLFAADCAERVAHLWAPVNDIAWTPADAITVARRFARGEATLEELEIARATAQPITDTVDDAEIASGNTSGTVAYVADAAACALDTDAHYAADGAAIGAYSAIVGHTAGADASIAWQFELAQRYTA